MSLLTLSQIPCHHVLANEIDLNLKYRIGLKHFFNINLGIGIIKKNYFLFVFLTYLPVCLLKFRSRELVGCRIHHQVFSGISCFWGSGACKKYVEWVLVGCKI